MRLTDVTNFFKGNLSPIDFGELIKPEVRTYKEALSKGGSSTHVLLTEDDNNDFDVGVDELKRLCNAYLEALFDKWQVYYICDAILLSNRFSFKNENVREAIETMTDPEINGDITVDRIREILSEF